MEIVCDRFERFGSKLAIKSLQLCVWGSALLFSVKELKKLGILPVKTRGKKCGLQRTSVDKAKAKRYRK